MGKQPIIIIGGGGHCRDLLWLLKDLEAFEIQGIVDDRLPVGSLVGDVAVVGGNEELRRFTKSAAVVAIGNSRRRKQVFDLIEAEYPGFDFPTIIHPTAKIAPGVSIGKGTVVCAGCILSSKVSLGSHCIANLGAIIGHDVEIGDFCSVGPGVVIAGGARIANGCELGANASIRGGVSMGQGSMAALGAAVMNDVAPQVLVIGNPARPIRELNDFPV
jgi:sugar O-acyltransferase (sialic acid O-acetyltransferase NeuD family)